MMIQQNCSLLFLKKINKKRKNDRCIDFFFRCIIYMKNCLRLFKKFSILLSLLVKLFKFLSDEMSFVFPLYLLQLFIFTERSEYVLYIIQPNMINCFNQIFDKKKKSNINQSSFDAICFIVWTAENLSSFCFILKSLS